MQPLQKIALLWAILILPITAFAQTGPGGVGTTDGSGSLSLWLDASTITDNFASGTWSDQSGYGYDANVLNGNSPTYSPTGGGNGQPSLYFNDNNNEALFIPDNSDIRPTNELSIFVAASHDQASETWGSLVNTSRNYEWDTGWGMAEEAGDMYLYVGDYDDASDRARFTSYVDEQNEIWGLIYNSGSAIAYQSETAITITSPLSPTINYSGTPDGNSDLLIGAGPDDSGAAYFITGHIEEIILFDAALNTAERIIVNNYLSAKYEITIAGGSDIYTMDNNANGDFDFHVAGIGRVNASNRHEDSQGTGIVRINNASSLGNGDYLFWGFDGEAAEAREYSDIPAGVESRFVGQWRVSEVGEVGSINLSFDLAGLGDITASDLVLLIDSDNDGFADETPEAITATQNGTVYQFAGVTGAALENSYHFTIATTNLSQTALTLPLTADGPNGPGGVGDTDGTTDLALWLDASAITGVSNGADLNTWEDQSGYNNDATVTSSINGTNTPPNYYSTAGSNSRATVTFNGNTDPGDAMEVPGSPEILPTDGLSVFWVGDINDDENWAGVLFTADDDNWDDGWGFARDNGTTDSYVWVEDSGNPGFKIDNSDWGTNHIWNFNYDGSSLSSYKSETLANSVAYSGGISYDAGGAGKNDNLLIGRSWHRDEHHNGDISEIIQFRVGLNEAQRIIVANYLSAKYAIGIPVASDVYNEDNAGNGNYDYEVAGIGQASDGSKHTDAQGSGIVRVLNATDLDDDEFLIWGHDNGALTATETSDIPTEIDGRFERVWRVSETADVGSVDMVWDLSSLGISNTNYVRLLVDTDNDGFFNDETPISNPTLISGNTFGFTGVSALADNRRFTIGVIEPAPGNVTANLEVWLRSDEGTVGGPTITSWEDQSINSNDVTATGTPDLISSAINYNPAIDFDGTGDYLSTTNTTLIGDNNAYTKIAVVISDDITSGQAIIGSDAVGDHDMRHNNSGSLRGRHGGSNWAAGPTFVEGQAHIASVRYGSVPANNMSSLDGERTADATPYNFTDNGSAIEIGGRNSGTQLFDGLIAEAIVYHSDKSDNDFDQIESYLAIKYGITLDNSNSGSDPTDGDYVASDGTTVVWDADDSPAYHNHVIGIGRDDNSGLYQRQSKTYDDSLIVYIDNLAADNASNAGVIGNDVSYLTIGHDGGVLRSFWNEQEKPASIAARFVREWKVTNTNFSETYSIEFEWEEVGTFNINDIRLLVDDDGDFSDATVLGPADGLTFTVGSIVVSGLGTSHIPVNDTKFITLGSVSGSTPLPIELTSFDATPVDNQAVELRWETTTETNNDFFTIERSLDSEDWEHVAFVEGAGTSIEANQYSEMDYYPYSGTSYYRLKQTDIDGKFTYSGVVIVALDEFGSQLIAYPVPAQDIMTVEGEPRDLRELKVYSQSGQDLSGNVRFIEESARKVVLDISILEDGIYILNPDNREKSLRFIKEE